VTQNSDGTLSAAPVYPADLTRMAVLGSGIDFHNSYSSPLLPDTGGMGTGPYILGGITLAITLSVLLSGALIYRHHRRRRCLDL